MAVKKFRFGIPEKIVPSVFCDGFNYQEGEIEFHREITFKQNQRGCVIEFPMEEQERIYGLGLQLKAFNLAGSKYTLRVNSDPIAATGDSHAPVPFFVSTSGYGVYLDSTRNIEFEFGRKKPQRISTENRTNSKIALSEEELYKVNSVGKNSYVTIQIHVAEGVDMYVFDGKNITDIVAQYNRMAGGGCDVPSWGLGFFYRCCATYGQSQVMETAKYFKEKDFPCTIIGIEPGWQTKAYSASFVWNREKFPEPEKMIDELYGMGFHVNLWEHGFIHPTSPMYSKMYDYACDYTVWDGLVPDFSLKEAREIFIDYHKNNVIFDKVDGFKMDECDGSDYRGGWSFPLCSKFPSGMDGEQYHAMFGTLYMKTILELLGDKPTLSEVRSQGALCSPYPFVLYSDLYDHRDFIRGLATCGFSGILWTPEMRYVENKQDLLRRVQTIVFAPQCLVNGWRCEQFPWLDYDCEEEIRYWLNIRKSLIPTIKKAFEKYKDTGIPPIRALVSDYTDDEQTYAIDDEYVFCDDYIVAPIMSGEEKRTVYLPEGVWTDFYTGEKVEAGTFEVETDKIPVYKKANNF